MAKVFKNRLLVRRLVLTQLLAVVVTPLLFILSSGVAAYSALAGALIYFVPNLYFVYRAFKFSGARSAKKILRSFYAGESVKLLLSAAFFAMTFALVKPLDVLALFTGFIAVQASSWLTPWLTAGKNT